MLSKNDKKIIEVFREKGLSHLIRSFLVMLELNKLGKITVHKMTWKYIMTQIHDEYSTKQDIEEMFIAYFVSYGIITPKKKRVDTRLSKERVKDHREKKKQLGYKTVTVQVSPADFDRLKRYKKDFNLTYQEAFSNLISTCPVKRK